MRIWNWYINHLPANLALHLHRIGSNLKCFVDCNSIVSYFLNDAVEFRFEDIQKRFSETDRAVIMDINKPLRELRWTQEILDVGLREAEELQKDILVREVEF